MWSGETKYANLRANLSSVLDRVVDQQETVIDCWLRCIGPSKVTEAPPSE